MSGILYSQDSSGFTDLEILKKRGPDDFKEETNPLGYFACSVLNILDSGIKHLKKTKSGILLYNGSTKSNNDKNAFSENLDDSLNNTIDFVKDLCGSYALIYVTERHVGRTRSNYKVRHVQ